MNRVHDAGALILIRRMHIPRAAPLQNCADRLLGAFSVDVIALTDIMAMMPDMIIINPAA
jgi:hypothetical protein